MLKQFGWILCMGCLVHTASAQYSREGFYEPEIMDSALFSNRSNLLLDAKVSADNHWHDRTPRFAVDGKKNSAGDHWAGLNLPVQLTADMGHTKNVSAIRITLYWPGGRIYKYLIEGSADGKIWTQLVDARDNKKKSTAGGFIHEFTSRSLRYMRTTITDSSQHQNGGHIVELEAYGDKKIASKIVSHQKTSLKGAVGSVDIRYKRGRIPKLDDNHAWRGTAWAGERLNGQLVIRTSSDTQSLSVKTLELKNKHGKKLSGALTAHFVRYTKGRGGIIADILETDSTIPINRISTRPVWITVNIPSHAKPGLYHGQVEVISDKQESVSFNIEVEVLPLTLTQPADWPFHLDLWQNPYSVARYHEVQLWSDEHFALLKPLYELLASAGQKCITTSLIDKPWGGQTFDPFGSMIEWTLNVDGSWSYDYSVFDKYVEFVQSTGIDKQINCYSMIPWGDRFRYYDKSSDKHVTFKAVAGTERYENHWRPFLKDFIKHLKQKGWLEKTAIAMDERPHKIMVKLLDFMKREAPELKMASAINYAKKSGSGGLYDISVSLGHADSIDNSYLESRINAGQKTTFYVCCGPTKPNTFTHSPPAESAWQGIHASALGYDGFLRWAYCSWVKDPLMDTSYPKRNWAPGDCFLVYPGCRSSIRFERLREGIQTYEKIRLLREMVSKSGNNDAHSALENLDNILKESSYKNTVKNGADGYVNKTHKAIEKISRAIVK